jgi:Dictyostelium (slime mold) repeat
MDGRQFDKLTKALATGVSRRRVLRGAVGSAIGGMVSLIRIRGGSAGDKVVVCHLTGSATNPVVQIEVSVNAIPAHEAHGDVIAPDFATDVNNCGGCGIVCGGGDACNTPTCLGGECTTASVSCDDSNACTDDSCDPATGCVHTPISCDDSDICTTDTCDPATGCVHTPISCDDSDICTTDTCDPATGCVHTPIVGCCHIDADCPRGEVCIDNVCTANPAPVCAGETCDTFTQCSPANPDCVCTTVVGGGGICVPGSTPCANLTPCPSGPSDCATGELCVEQSCCGEQVCVPINLSDQCPLAGVAITSEIPRSAERMNNPSPTLGGH